MDREYEIVSYNKFKCLNVFLVRIFSRTPHLHRDLELGLILDGQVNIQSGGTVQLLKKQDLYLINSMEAHEFQSDKNGAGALLLSIQLSPRFFESFLADSPNIYFLSSPNIKEYYNNNMKLYEFLCAVCVELGYQYFAMPEDYEFRCAHLVTLLFFSLKSSLKSRTISPENYLIMKQKTDRIFSVIDYIEQNFTRKLLLKEIAEKEKLSLNYLSHLFRESLGISFQDYLKEKRLEYACRLISTTQRKILDISISSGFSDARYLNKLFMKRFGCTPKEYRKGNQTPYKKASSPVESSQFFFTAEKSVQLITPMRIKLRKQIEYIKFSELFSL